MHNGDIDELFLNAVSMRWLIIDECSSASPGLLGALDVALRRACLSHPYAKENARPRPFGGINVIFAGDLWQLAPVQGIPIFANPFSDGREIEEQWILKMFWQKTGRAGQGNKDGIQKSFTLTESKRTKDPWLQAVLQQDRNGSEDWEVYCFAHGLPTLNPGSWLPDHNGQDGSVVCGNNVCKTLRAKWQAMFEEKVPWAARVELECEACWRERRRRCCIISENDENIQRFKEPIVQWAVYFE